MSLPREAGSDKRTSTVGYHLGRTWPPPEMSVCYNRAPLKISKLTRIGILNAQPPETAVVNERQSLEFPDSINRTVRQIFEIRNIFEKIGAANHGFCENSIISMNFH